MNWLKNRKSPCNKTRALRYIISRQCYYIKKVSKNQFFEGIVMNQNIKDFMLSHIESMYNYSHIKDDLSKMEDDLYNLIENINSKTEYTKNDIQQLINTFETVLITAKQTYFEHGATSGISNINKIYLTPSEVVLHG